MAPQATGIAAVDWSRPEMTQKMQEKSQRSYQNRGGAQYKGIMSLEKLGGINIGKISINDHYWSIIPYLAGQNDPDPKVKPGDPTYTVGVYTHKVPGTTNKIICLARTYGQPCEFCRYREELDRTPDGPDDAENKRRQEEIKSLLPSRNMTHLYYIWDRNKEREGIKVYEISAYFFEDELTTQAFDPRTKVMIPFMSPQQTLLGDGRKNPAGGMDVFFKVSGDLSRQNWSGIKLVDRDQPIPQWVLEQARVPLDELLNIPTSEEVADLFWAGQQAEGQEPEPQGYAGPPAGSPQQDQVDQARQFCSDFQTGKCGSYADCQSCHFYADCSQAGVVPSGADDIPFEPPAPEQPPPGPPPGPAAAPPGPVPRPGGSPIPLRRTPR